MNRLETRRLAGKERRRIMLACEMPEDTVALGSYIIDIHDEWRWYNYQRLERHMESIWLSG